MQAHGPPGSPLSYFKEQHFIWAVAGTEKVLDNQSLSVRDPNKLLLMKTFVNTLLFDVSNTKQADAAAVAAEYAGPGLQKGRLIERRETEEKLK